MINAKRRVVRYSTSKHFSIYCEGMGEKSFSNSDSVLNRGTEPITRFRLGFVLKLGLVLQIPIIGIGMGSRFVFQFSSRGLDVDEIGSICYHCCLYF